MKKISSLTLLQQDIAILIAEKENKILEIDCLRIGRKKYLDAKNWNRVASYDFQIEKIEKVVVDMEDNIKLRLVELRRLEEHSNKQQLNNLKFVNHVHN
jgi:hypothetical protein